MEISRFRIVPRMQHQTTNPKNHQCFPRLKSNSTTWMDCFSMEIALESLLWNNHHQKLIALIQMVFVNLKSKLEETTWYHKMQSMLIVCWSSNEWRTIWWQMPIHPLKIDDQNQFMIDQASWVPNIGLSFFNKRIDASRKRSWM